MTSSIQGTDPARERLRQIEAVTDRALAYLDLEDLLGELLNRTRESLEADTAAVLLLDRSGRYLVATAASGLEEEVSQGASVPIGRGFAGRIAAEKQPVQIHHVDRDNVVNPILLAKRIHSLLGVPLLVEGRVIGVLHVGTLTRRVFEAEEVDLLQMVGDRIALAVGAHLSTTERAAARTLQRSLLPERLADVNGLSLAARYVGGGGGRVGGDWYDVCSLPSGSVCITVGDVVGKGLHAATVMGRIRTALRAYALEAEDPAEILQRVDHQLQHFEPGQMATVLCAITEPPFDRLVMSLAGHLPPVLALPEGEGVLFDVGADPPLGAGRVARREPVTMAFPAGAVLCAYTDGLIERRGEHLDLGLERMRRAVRAEPPESVCAAVMAEFIGREVPEDDVAVLVVRRDPSPEPD